MSKRIIYIHIFLILIFLFNSSIVVSSFQIYFTYPEVTVHYDSQVYFENFTITYMGLNIVLNGSIRGLLYAKFVFKENVVLVSMSYINYSLSGFNNELSREYIVKKLVEKPVYVFNKSEQPYELNKPFIIEGGVKYYVSPDNLDLSGVVDQSIGFVLDNYTVLYEKRYFKYDIATGVLCDLYINSRIYVNNTLYSNYTIQFKQIYSSEYRLNMNQLNKWLIMSISLSTALFFLTITHIVNRLRRK